jgi:hypothetical protein
MCVQFIAVWKVIFIFTMKYEQHLSERYVLADCYNEFSLMFFSLYKVATYNLSSTVFYY